MPCDTCKRRCDNECGFIPEFWDEWDENGKVFCSDCKGYVKGDPVRDCKTCTKVDCEEGDI